MSDSFERVVRIKSAFDCEVIRPCVHGSDRCGTVPGASHGRHNAEMHMILRGPDAEVTLVVVTGWSLPETPLHVRTDDGPRGAFVEFHSAQPQYEGQESITASCERWATCYVNTGFTMAEEPTELLVRKGSDAVWEWLESAYHDTFDSILGGAR